MKSLKLLLVPFAFVAVVLIRLLAKFGFYVRFGQIMSERIGHLAGNTECYLCEKKEGLQKGFDIWLHRLEPANKYLARKYDKLLHVDRTNFSRIVHVVNCLFRGWEKHVVDLAQFDRDIHKLVFNDGAGPNSAKHQDSFVPTQMG